MAPSQPASRRARSGNHSRRRISPVSRGRDSERGSPATRFFFASMKTRGGQAGVSHRERRRGAKAEYARFIADDSDRRLAKAAFERPAGTPDSVSAWSTIGIFTAKMPRDLGIVDPHFAKLRQFEAEHTHSNCDG